MSEAPDFSHIPVYQDFFHAHQSFERYHIHLIGLTSLNGSGEVGKRRNRFGRPRVMDAIADPYITVETEGREDSEDSATGSTDYFPIGKHTFPVLKDCRTPIWDGKCLLLGKKEATTGITVTVWDHNDNADDEMLWKIDIDRSELPDITDLKSSQWTPLTIRPDDTSDPRVQSVALQLQVMITDGADRLVGPESTPNLVSDGSGTEYSTLVLTEEDSEGGDQDGTNNALLECWTRPSTSTKAVLWFLGRNDCFMHPHVATQLFLDQGYDVFVLNYRMNGQCRGRGWVTDPHYNSHNKEGSFDVYIKDIQKSLQHIESHSATTDYETIIGYAHSTGGPVLLNYLMEEGDDAFDGFIFNSPFLDWGFVGGDMVEFVLEHTGVLERLGAMDHGTKVGVATTPEALAATPLHYLDQEIVLSAWSARLWSLYSFPWGSRPLYKVPMTVGFAQGVTAVHQKMATWHKDKRPITAKPFLCITSRGDDVLKAPETLSRADWIGPGRWEVELNDNGHDVFLSYDANDTDMAIQMCLTWMKNRRFAK